MATPGGQVGKTRETLLVRLVGGHWVVSDGQVTLATAQSHTISYELDIDAGGRQLTFRMVGKGMLRSNYPKDFDVIDGGTGQQVLHGKFISGGRSFRGGIKEEWTVTLASGNTVSWIYQPDPRRLGFYDPSGAPVLLIGHDPSFAPPAKASVFRILLRFWAAAAASNYRYIARVETGAIGRLVSAEDVPVLALLAMWLERTVDGRYPSGSSDGGTGY